MREIVFVRHAESEANASNVWNGRSDGPLSELGEATLEPLGSRLADWDFDVVLSSPLERARRTAGAFADEIQVDEELVEIDLGAWEGLHFDEVMASHGEELQRALSTRSAPMGGTGESIEDVTRRALRAVDSLFESLAEGQRAAVVTHGGFLQSVLHRHLAGKGRRAHTFLANTSITRIAWQYGRPRLITFNDTAHLGPRSKLMQAHLESEDAVVALIRHGRTRANVEGIWQGQGDWDLDETGRRQANALAEWYGPVETVYSSPLKRAASTADRIAMDGVVRHEGLMELSMGRWEGLNTDQIAEGWPGMMERIYRDGVDLRRGETGESWGELTARFANAVSDTGAEEGRLTAIVAHGGAIRAYVSSLTATDDTHAESLFTPANTSVTHVAFTERGPEILDYAVAAHLESLQ